MYSRDVGEKTIICGYVRRIIPGGFGFEPIGELKTFYGNEVTGIASKEHLDEIERLYLENKDGLVRIACVGVSRNSMLVRLDSISRVERATGLPDATTQLEDLRNLKDGWYEGDGFAPSGEGLDWLDDALFREYDCRLPSPRIYPMFDGDVQLEWMIGRNDASLEVILSERRGYWHNLNLTTDEDEERLLNLNDREEWRWLNARLRRMVESAE